MVFLLLLKNQGLSALAISNFPLPISSDDSPNEHSDPLLITPSSSSAIYSPSFPTLLSSPFKSILAGVSATHFQSLSDFPTGAAIDSVSDVGLTSLNTQQSLDVPFLAGGIPRLDVADQPEDLGGLVSLGSGHKVITQNSSQKASWAGIEQHGSTGADEAINVASVGVPASLAREVPVGSPPCASWSAMVQQNIFGDCDDSS